MYTITYSSEYGMVPQSISVRENTVLTEQDLPSLYGHRVVFKGWYDGETKVIAGEYTVTKNVTLTARRGSMASILYESKISYAPDVLLVEYDHKLTEEDLRPVDCSPYVFLGWFYSKDENNNGTGIQAKVDDRITEDVTLYAKWKTATISFSTQFGEVPSLNMYVGGKIYSSQIQTLYQTGYIFDGWFNGSTWLVGDYRVTGDETFTAVWRPIEYNIVYNCEGGELPSNTKTKYTIAEDITLAIPERDNYTFCGWYNSTYYNADEITGWNAGDKTETVYLYAKWVLTEHQIIYHCNGGYVPSNAVTKYTAQDNVTLPSAYYNGHTFKGWYETEDFTSEKMTGWDKGGKTGTVNLYAKWTLDTYSIVYNCNGGTLPADTKTTYTVDDTVVLAEPEKLNYTFCGWYTTSNLRYSEIEGWNPGEQTGRITLYAKWELTEYRIIYDPYVNSSVPSDAKRTYTIEDSVTLPIPQRDNYYFRGWFETKNYSTEEITGWDAGTKTGDINLYAKWLDNVSYIVEQIENMTESGTVVATGKLEYYEISIIKQALETLRRQNNSVLVSLDLSKVTGITELNYYNFKNCSNLSGLVLPDTIKTIGANAFYGCSNLTSITLSSSLESIGNNAFENCTSLASIEIPGSVKTIGESAFENCSSLASVVFKWYQKVESFGKKAFSHCSSLTGMVIPDSVKTIGESAFCYCTSLASINIPNTLASIEASTFDHCSSLTSITIPTSVKFIGDHSFNECSSLTSVTYEDNKTDWYFGYPPDDGRRRGGGGNVLYPSNPAGNARRLTDTYKENYFYRASE
ncbi:MAG: leucine-rich repeat protein [Treponema sp.]|nr:leucine-rich repeat protein [Treponema sp.]